MKSKAFAHFTLTYLPTIGMFIFLTIFLVACFMVFRKKNKKMYEEMSQLPLEEKG